MPRLSKETWEQVIKETYETNNMTTVAKRYGITKQAIMYQLDKRGLPHVKGGHRRLGLNTTRFLTLDEHSAYWLGFIMADGYVLRTTKLYKRPNRLSINLSAKDKHHLEKFKDFIGTDSDIKVYSPQRIYAKYDMCRLDVNSTVLCETLANFEIRENKTGNEKFPVSIPDRLIRHFIRGFFDGDGSVSNPTNRSGATFSICSSFGILSYIQTYLVSDCGLSFTKIIKDKRHDNVFSLVYTGTQTSRIYDYLYQDSTVYLERKKDKFNLLLSK